MELKKLSESALNPREPEMTNEDRHTVALSKSMETDTSGKFDTMVKLMSSYKGTVKKVFYLIKKHYSI